MRLHTNTMTDLDLYTALRRAKNKGRVTQDVYFWAFERHRSRSRAGAYEIQLGTADQTSGPTRSRHYKNSGQYGARSERNGEPVWSATYEEWGWFIAELFAVEPDLIFGSYKGLASFNEQTGDKFLLEPTHVIHAEPELVNT